MTITDADIDAQHEVLAAIVRHTEAELQSLGMDRQAARSIGWTLMRRLADAFGGETMYLPKGDAIQRHETYQQIWTEFRGSNIKDLARKYGLSTVAVRNILRRMRDAERKRMREEGGKT